MKKLFKPFGISMMILSLGLSNINQPFNILAVEEEIDVKNNKVIDKREIKIAPDATYTWSDMEVDDNKEKVHYVEFDLQNSNLDLQVGKSNDYVYGLQTVSGMANDYDKEGNRVVAAINGDFYHMNNGIPLGTFINDGKIITDPPGTWLDWYAFGVKEDNTVVFGKSPKLHKKLIIPGNSVLDINFINRIPAIEDALVLFTSDFYSSTKTNDNRDEYICEIIIGDEVRANKGLILQVKDIRKNTGNTEIKDGEVVLSASGKFKDSLSKLKKGDELATFFNIENKWKDVKLAVGGQHLIVDNGKVANINSKERGPRVAIGVKEDGKIVMLEVDGRSSGFSEGVTLKELGEMMKDLGCVNALNLDGGGSATFLGRLPGEINRTVLNKLSDGKERRVANSIMLINKGEESDASNFVVQPNFLRILQGNEFDFNYAAIDKNYHPATFNGNPKWELTDSSLGKIDQDGIFKAGENSGTTKIKVAYEDIVGFGEVEIVDDITEIKLNYEDVIIAPGEELDFDIKAFRNGQEILADDTSFEWVTEGSIGSIDENGIFTASELENESGKIIVNYKNPTTSKVITTSIDVNIRDSVVIIEDFESGNKWEATGVRYNEILYMETSNNVKFGNKAGLLAYDFRDTVGTSGVYLAPKEPIELEGYPKKIGMWVKGDGKEHWLRSQLRDGNNKIINLDFISSSKGVDFNDWKYLEVEIPKGLALPLKIDLPVRYMAIDDSKKSFGFLLIDEIQAIY
ncbi:MAG: phosphodiester glycosidase family protein [Eubacteriales bacterium]